MTPNAATLSRPSSRQSDMTQSRPQSRQTDPGIRRSSSFGALPSLQPRPSSSGALQSTNAVLQGQRRSASTDFKRRLHETRQRDWLKKHGKHSCMDFSDSERTELRHFFEGLSGSHGSDARIGIAELEEMLISLGVADTRADVLSVIATLDGDETGELDFEEYLRIVCMGDAESTVFQVFKAMLRGKLGDRNLNFPNVISTYRRKLILDASGVGSFEKNDRSLDDSREDVSNPRRGQRGQKARYTKMLDNFETLNDSMLGRLNASHGKTQSSFPTKSVAGSLATAWNSFCTEYNLKPVKQFGGGSGAASTLGRPQSPNTVLEKIPGLRQSKFERSNVRTFERSDVRTFHKHSKNGDPLRASLII